MITLRQRGNNRRSYLFEKSWGRDGGVFFGENFFSDLCTGKITARESTRIVQIDDDTWEIASIDTDPDFLLYMWKRARGEKFDFYVQDSEVIFLYEFFKQNGFIMMLEEIESASDRLEKKNGERYLCIVL